MRTRACTAVLALTLLAGCASRMSGTAPNIDTLTAAEAAAGVCAGRWRSEDLVAAYVARAKARPELNAFVTLDEAGATAAARAIDGRRTSGSACRPLEGVPVVVKDNIHVAGLPSTAGTAALRSFVPSADAPVVQRLRDAGAVVLGKTNLHELAFGITGFNPTFTTGPAPGVRNAYDSSLMAGGSSSGTGAALGARMAPAGLGTDTGGSVRIPCALNGCAGLRPTIGRYPQDGLVPISRHARHRRPDGGFDGRRRADGPRHRRRRAGGRGRPEGRAARHSGARPRQPGQRHARGLRRRDGAPARCRRHGGRRADAHAHRPQ